MQIELNALTRRRSLSDNGGLSRVIGCAIGAGRVGSRVGNGKINLELVHSRPAAAATTTTRRVLFFAPRIRLGITR